MEIYFTDGEEPQEHDLLQGTDDWAAFRLTHFGASEAAAVLGLSSKVSRNDLLKMKATGVAEIFGDWVQRNILDYGHEVEAMARPIIEQRIGRKLYPVTCSRGILSASCDGLTAQGDIAFEHKQWNIDLAEAVAAGELPDEYMPQCQQILMVTGAVKVIFVVSDGTEANMLTLDVLPDPEWFERIRAGWAQFATDLAEYVPPVIVADAVAEPVKDLPAVAYEMNGMSLTSNIATVVKPSVLAQIAKYDRIPETDQDFADLKAFTESARSSVKKSEVLRETVMAKIVDVDKFNRELIELEGLLTKAAISGEKIYKAENENRKNAIKATGPARFAEYVDALQTEIVGVRLIIPAPDWAKAAYGLKSLKSLENAIDTCLANAKIAADTIAKDVRDKLAWYKENADGFGFLFSDLAQIIGKPLDDFKLVVTTRIEAHKKAEAEKAAEAIRRIEAEAKEKAEREAAAKMAADEARIRAEERAKAEQEAKARAEAEAETRAAEQAELVRQQPQREAVAAESVPQEQPTVPLAAPQAQETVSTATDTGATINLGEINKRLSFTVSADFLASLGFPARQEKNARIFRECDFPAICEAIAQHLGTVRRKVYGAPKGE